MKSSKLMRTGLTAAVCAAVGAAGGIAGSAAAPAKSSTAKAKAAHNAGARGPMGGPGGHAVHEDEVVLNKAGTAFITATQDEGTLKSVSGNDITITEGTATVTYKDVTITIPDGATIKRNGATATVADLKTGDRVHVSQSSDGVTVFAGDSTFRPMGHGGPGGPGGPHDGPPPAAPGG